MPTEPLPDVTPLPTADPAGSDVAGTDSSGSGERPVELSEFSQRLASFGLGEAPDPLLTEARRPVKRRSRP